MVSSHKRKRLILRNLPPNYPLSLFKDTFLQITDESAANSTADDEKSTQDDAKILSHYKIITYNLTHPPSYILSPSIDSLKNMRPSFATITFDTVEACHSFYDANQLRKIEWREGNKERIYTVLIEYAPLQKYRGKAQRNAFSGLIEKDWEYLKWLEEDTKPVEMKTSAEEWTANVRDDDVKTPLIEAMAQRSHNKMDRKHAERKAKLDAAKKASRKDKKRDKAEKQRGGISGAANGSAKQDKYGNKQSAKEQRPSSAAQSKKAPEKDTIDLKKMNTATKNTSSADSKTAAAQQQQTDGTQQPAKRSYVSKRYQRELEQREMQQKRQMERQMQRSTKTPTSNGTDTPRAQEDPAKATPSNQQQSTQSSPKSRPASKHQPKHAGTTDDTSSTSSGGKKETKPAKSTALSNILEEEDEIEIVDDSVSSNTATEEQPKKRSYKSRSYHKYNRGKRT